MPAPAVDERDRPLRILLVEDDDVDAELVAEMLSPSNPPASMTILRARRLEEAFALLDVDVALLDLMLPDSRGMETLRRLREQAPDLPIVVLSGLDDDSVGLQAVRSGAQDYLPKGHVGLRMLQRVIQYAVERNQARQRLQRLATLEGEVAERRLAEERLRRSEVQLAEAQRLAHVGSWEWDIAANRVRWTDETYHIFGRSVLDFDGTYEAMLNAFHPEDRALVHAAVARAYESLGAFEGVYRVVRMDGSVRTVQARGEVLTGASGAAARMLGTFQDVTSAVAASSAAREHLALISFLMRLLSHADPAEANVEAASPSARG